MLETETLLKLETELDRLAGLGNLFLFLLYPGYVHFFFRMGYLEFFQRIYCIGALVIYLWLTYLCVA